MRPRFFACRIRGGFVLGLEHETRGRYCRARTTLALIWFAVGVTW